MTLIDCLSAGNPWWKTGEVEPVRLHKRIRSEFSQMVKTLVGSEPIILTGPRGCGKTGLLYQTVDYLLRLHVPKERILFFSGDDPSLFIHNLRARDILVAYCTGVLKEAPESLSAPVYVLTDEANRVEGWRLFALQCRENDWPFRFVAASPSSRLLFPPGSEALRARCRLFCVPPLSLSQFVEFYGTYRRSDFDFLAYKSLLPAGGLFEDTEGYVRALMEKAYALDTFRPGKRRLVGQYLLAGGYPGFFAAPGLAAWQMQLFDEVIDRGLYGDIVSNTAIRSPDKLKNLLYYIAMEEGREEAYAGVARYFSLNTVTVMNHLRLLTEAGFVAVCEYYTENLAGVMRRNKRIYLRDAGIKNALLKRRALTPEQEAQARREAALSMLFDEADKSAGQVWYWRGAREDAPVFVLETKGRKLPVQFFSMAGPNDVRALRSFCRAFSAKNALVFTRETLDVRDGIAYVPFWML